MDVKARHGRRWFLGAIIAAVGLVFLSRCAPKANVEAPPPPPPPELAGKAAEAEALFKKGCYVGFKRAIDIYHELYAQPSMRGKILLPYVKTLILMSVREKEIGILNERYIQKAGDLVKQNPSLQAFAPYLQLSDTMYPKTKGVMRDINIMATRKVVDDVLKNVQLKNEMKARAQSDDYYAYLYVNFYAAYANYFEQKEELLGFAKLYPDSILFKYKYASADHGRIRSCSKP